MTEAQARLIARLAQRVARERPELQRALLRAIGQLGANLDDIPDRMLAQLVSSGDMERLLAEVLPPAQVDQAMQPLREAIREATAGAFRGAATDMPQSVLGPGIRFDLLDPRIMQAVQTVEVRRVDGLTDAMATTLRETVAAGIQAGDPPATIARALRSTLGLTPKQAEAVRNYRRLLESGDADALTRALRDKRFDATSRKGDLTEAQIDKMVGAYERRTVAMNANLQATAMARDAQFTGQQLAWKEAGDNLDGGQLMKTWHHLPGQLDPRPEHEAMDGATVPIDQPYPNGDQFPGESDPWNCFAEGTAIEGAFIGALKIPYSGPLREIKTARGHRLAVTPNHPIMTPQGWVAARALSKGDYVFGDARCIDSLAVIGVDHQDRPAVVEDVFNTLGAEGISNLPSGVQLDLHGDAVHINGEVSVVRADGNLGLELPIAAQNLLDYRPFAMIPLPASISEGAVRPLDTLSESALAPARSAPCGAEEPFGGDGIAVDMLPSIALAIGAAAHWNVPVPQIEGDGAARIPAFLRDLEEASAGLITIDEIVDVRDYFAESVHVYDVQSVTGWLLAGNILVSNCHCWETHSVVYSAAMVA